MQNKLICYFVESISVGYQKEAFSRDRNYKFVTKEYLYFEKNSDAFTYYNRQVERLKHCCHKGAIFIVRIFERRDTGNGSTDKCIERWQYGAEY